MEKIPFPPIYIRYSGLFDFDAVYSTMIEWCKNEGYLWQEDVYKHKVPTPAGAEQEWIWSAENNLTSYFQYKIQILGHSWDLREVEVVKNGKKKTLISGRIELKFVGTMVLDWQKKMDKNNFTKFLGKMYYRINRREIEGNYGDGLWYHLFNLHAAVKKAFDMQTKAHEYKRYLGEG